MKYLLLVIILFLSSCTAIRYVDREIPIETIRTEYIDKLYKDSIYIHDSIDRYIKGDSVFQYKYKYIYRYLNRTDTIIRTDSIEVPVKITETKEINKLKWYQSILMWIGCITMLFLSFKLGRLIRNKVL